MSITPPIAVLLAAGALAAGPGSTGPGSGGDPTPSLTVHADRSRLTADAPGATAIAWDLDGDGLYDDAAGPEATALPGVHHVRVQAQWLGGAVPIARTATRAVTAP
jgi:hypothetical protein